MFLPGIGLLDWDYFTKKSDWNILFLVGACSVTMGCVNTTGAMSWIVNHMLYGITSFSPLFLLLLVGLIVAGVRAFIPTGPTLVAIFVPILLEIAQATGQSSVLFVLITVFWGGAAMLLVYTEPMFLYTFGYGYYTAKDLLIAGMIPTLSMVVILATIFPKIVALVGY